METVSEEVASAGFAASESLEEILPIISDYTVSGLDAFGLPGASVMDVMEVVTERAFTAIDTFADYLDSSETADVQSFVSDLSGTFVENLGDAGLAPADLAANIDDLLSAMVGTLDAFVATEELMGGFLQKMTEGAVSKIGNAMDGLTMEHIGPALEGITGGATLGLDDIVIDGYDEADVGDMLGFITYGAFSVFDEITFEGSGEAYLDEMAQFAQGGCIAYMDDIVMDGFDVNDIHGVLGSITESAFDALDQIVMDDYDSADLDRMFTGITEGAVGYLDMIEMDGYAADDLNLMVGTITEYAVGAFDKIEMTGWEVADFGSMAQHVTYGATSGLDDLVMDGFDTADVYGVMGDISSYASRGISGIDIAGFDETIVYDMMEGFSVGSTQGIGVLDDFFTDIDVDTMTSDLAASYTEGAQYFMDSFDIDVSLLEAEISSGMVSGWDVAGLDDVYDAFDAAALEEAFDEGWDVDIPADVLSGHCPPDYPDCPEAAAAEAAADAAAADDAVADAAADEDEEEVAAAAAAAAASGYVVDCDSDGTLDAASYSECDYGSGDSDDAYYSMEECWTALGYYGCEMHCLSYPLQCLW